jgi:hypothetical protein
VLQARIGGYLQKVMVNALDCEIPVGAVTYAVAASLGSTSNHLEAGSYPPNARGCWGWLSADSGQQTVESGMTLDGQAVPPG